MEHADRTNYEKEHPNHPPEKEFLDRTTRRIDEALRNVEETMERMARNAKRNSELR
jgi:hypothetical protein